MQPGSVRPVCNVIIIKATAGHACPAVVLVINNKLCQWEGRLVTLCCGAGCYLPSFQEGASRNGARPIAVSGW